MTNERYLDSASGRILLATTGMNVLAIGIFGLIGPSSMHLPILTIVPFASIILCIFAVGLATERDDSSAMFLVIGLPMIGGIAYAGLYVAPNAGWLIGA